MSKTELEKILGHEQSLPFCEVSYKGQKLKFAATNPKCYYFAESIDRREPDTNDWMSQITNKDVFFDVGANNSVFAILASGVYGATSYAFEPHFASYYISQKNIYANKLENKVKLFPIAVSEKTSLDSLFLSSATAGKSLNNFGDARPSEDKLWNAVIPQPAVSMSIDEICQQLDTIPTFLKIDVDGIEAKIVEGAMKTLSSPTLKELMIEFDGKKNCDVRAAEKIIDAGFNLDRVGPSGYFFRRYNVNF